MAKSRAEERDNYGKNSELAFDDASLLHISALVGIDLGCSIEMIDKNTEIINKMEVARRELYFQNIKREKSGKSGEECEENDKSEKDVPVYINTGDITLEELCSDYEHSDVDIEEQQMKKLRGMFSGGKIGRKRSPALDCVKQSLGIGVLRRRKKDKRF